MPGSASISCAASMSDSALRYALKASTTGSISARSRESLRKRSISLAISGSASRASISIRRCASCSSRLRIESFIEEVRGAELPALIGRGHQTREQRQQLGTLLGLALIERRHGTMQIFLSEPVGQRFEYPGRIFAAGEQAPGLLEFLLLDLLGCALQFDDGGDGLATLQPVHEILHPSLDNGLGLYNSRLAGISTALHQAAEIV